MTDTTIHLIHGTVFDYADPAATTLDVHDVAHALARTCRYGGHIMGYYSVAAHAMLTAVLVRHHYGEKGAGLGALHHDDVEAFTGDWPAPMKQYLLGQGCDYRKLLERPIEMVIARDLGLVLDELHAGVVKDADAAALVIEMTVLKPNGYEREGLPDLDPETIEKFGGFVAMLAGSDPASQEAAFLSVHESLVEEREAGGDS